MLELRSPLVAAAVTATVGLSIVVAAPATAAGTATSAKSATAKQAAAKKKAAKKTTKKKSAAAPKTVTACVNKKSGATKVLLGAKAKKKCAKGWTKMTWNVAGPAGKNGANGANGATGANGVKGADGGALLVRDAAGNRIGRFAGGFPIPLPFPVVQVLGDDGGLYTYLESGQLITLGIISGGGGALTPEFTDAACAGPAFLFAPAGSAETLSLFGGGTTRIVHRVATGPTLADLSPARVWKFTTTITTLSTAIPTVYELDPSSGACSATSGPPAGAMSVALQSIPAPPDGVGRLVIG